MNRSHKEGKHRIAIIGAGAVGATLATRFVRIGHSVTISNSRGPDTLRDVEKTTGAVARNTAHAISEADIVVLAVPMTGILPLQQILQLHKRPNTILVDACNYYPTRDGYIPELEDGMVESVWLAETYKSPVVKAFNNIIALNLGRSARPKGDARRVAFPVAGDDGASVAIVMDLVEELGFDAYNAGALAESWRRQPGQPAYCTEPTLAQLPPLLRRADKEGAKKKRDQGMGMAQKLPPNFSPDTMLRVARVAAGLDWGKPWSWVAVMHLLFFVIKGSLSNSS